MVKASRGALWHWTATLQKKKKDSFSFFYIGGRYNFFCQSSDKAFITNLKEDKYSKKKVKENSF